MNIEVFTQSAIKLTGKNIIYFDPYKIATAFHDADYIFITHDHYDHFDLASLKNVMKDDTKLIIPKIMEKEGRKVTNNIMLVEPNQNYELDSLVFRTSASYNLDKPYHPQEKGYVGYNIKIDETWYYIMGDTDVTEDIKDIKTDICFVPIGGTYTMNVQEAASYINEIKPKKVIPIHYGSIVGDISLKDDFQNLINKDIIVDIYIK